jgi:DNA-binding transcriptional regulator YdaS (Cro superfamily)
MDLGTWCKAEKGRSAQLARAVGLARGYIDQIASGDRPAPPRHCRAIEEQTGNQVRLWDLRPTDWWLIWPELLKAKGAPKVPGHSNRRLRRAAALEV